MIEITGFLLIFWWLLRRAQRREAERERQAQAVLRRATRVEPDLSIPPRPGLPAELRVQRDPSIPLRTPQSVHDALVAKVLELADAVADAHEMGMAYSVHSNNVLVDAVDASGRPVRAPRLVCSVETIDSTGHHRRFRHG